MQVSGHLHTPVASPCGTHRIGGCVGPRAGLDAMVRRKSPAPAGNHQYMRHLRTAFDEFNGTHLGLEIS
jgi:hypothetical protein